MNTPQAAVLLRAFGDGTRLRILNVLAQEPMSVNGLADLLQCPVHRVSRHLRYLLLRGIVEWSSIGNASIYRLADSAVALRQRVLPVVLDLVSTMPDARDDTAKLVREARKRRSAPRRGR